MSSSMDSNYGTRPRQWTQLMVLFMGISHSPSPSHLCPRQWTETYGIYVHNIGHVCGILGVKGVVDEGIQGIRKAEIASSEGASGSLQSSGTLV